MESEYPYGKLILLTNRGFTNGLLRATKNNDLSIVVHGTGTPGSIPSPGSIANFFRDDTQQRSSHFVIGQDGEVIQLIRLEDGAGANCCADETAEEYWQKYVDKYDNLNLCTISIEHCSNIDNSSYTETQLNASIKLVRWLQQKFQIPNSRIKPHKSINNTACPGSFPMEKLTMTLPSGAHDTGSEIVFSNEPYVITRGFRERYLELADHNFIPPNDAPINNEYPADPVEYSNPEYWKSPGTAQETRYFRFGWSPDAGVLVTWVGQESYYLRKQIEQTNALQLTEKTMQETNPESLLQTADVQEQGIDALPVNDVSKDNSTETPIEAYPQPKMTWSGIGAPIAGVHF